MWRSEDKFIWFYGVYGKWKSLKMSKVCPKIKEWKLQKFNLCIYEMNIAYSKNPSIIKNISSIKFSHLEHIELCGNNI